jgi:hypothetical protein
LNRSVREGIRFLRLRRLAEAAPSLSDRIEKLVYSVDLRDPDFLPVFSTEGGMLPDAARGERELLEERLAAFFRSHPESGARFWLDGRRKKLFLELPPPSRRGLRPQDIIAGAFGLRNPAFLLTRERLVFRGQASGPDAG